MFVVVVVCLLFLLFGFLSVFLLLLSFCWGFVVGDFGA